MTPPPVDPNALVARVIKSVAEAFAEDHCRPTCTSCITRAIALVEPLRDLVESTGRERDNALRNGEADVEVVRQKCNEIRALRAERDALTKDADRMLSAINWACGTGDSDFSDEPTAPRFWWRKRLTQLAGLTYDRAQCVYVRAARASEGTTR